ncbi:hypothetical protein Barb7_01039 [Bacteroidales bacterium Barb7]|nr:hypothetical protein Barb7_01039 [Bacteroidales bacterium Barb7]
MNWWIKFGCFLTGWNRQILKSCSETSHMKLKRNTSALLILIVLWAFTGYCFADRYINAPWWGCIITSIIFIIIVIQIERQIILTIGTNWGLAVFRFLIASAMAIIGSSIIDQIIFANDIENEKDKIKIELLKKQLPDVSKIINDKIAELKKDIESLVEENQELNKKLSENPVIVTSLRKDLTTTDTSGAIVKKEKAVDQIATESPLKAQVEINNEALTQLRTQLKDSNDEKSKVEENLKKKIDDRKPSFLEELDVMWEIITASNLTLFFYLTILLFLMFLELFVVVAKISDKKCDYELIMEHQLNVREESLKELVQKGIKKKE